MPAETEADEELRWVLAAAEAADDKLGTDICIIDVGAVLALTGYFVITSGRNTRQVRAIIDGIEEALTAAGGPKPLRTEGLGPNEWVLMDYGDFIVHVFVAEARDHYRLDHLWADQPRVPFIAGARVGAAPPATDD